MVSARDLLAQADALMRRHRTPGETEIPVLTEVVAAETPPVSKEPTPAAALSQSKAEPLAPPISQFEAGLLEVQPDVADLPLLEEVVIPPVKSEPSPKAPPPPPPKPAPVAAPAPPQAPAKVVPAAPAPQMAAASAAAAPAPAMPAPPVAAPAPVAPPAQVDQRELARETLGAALWDELANDIYHRILQSLDLYTDKAIRQHLAGKMQAILQRTSEDLIAELNHQIGTLLRDYIAKALEDEIFRVRARIEADRSEKAAKSTEPRKS